MKPAPAITPIPVRTTTVEWPALNASPTEAGLRPSETNLRVELSIIETWSKSKECTSPRKYAVAATATVTAPAVPATTPRVSNPSPITCSTAITVNAAPTRNRNDLDSRPSVVSKEPRVRVVPAVRVTSAVVAGLVISSSHPAAPIGVPTRCVSQ